METTQETTTKKAAKPEIREEKPQQEMQMHALPMELSAETKKKLRSRTVWPTSDLYIDRPVADGGYGSFAADGREFLEVDSSVVKSLLSHYSENKGVAYQSILPVKVTLCGTEEKPLLVVLNGRQRIKAIDFINRLLTRIWEQWNSLDRDKVKLRNALITQAESARNGVSEYADFAMLDMEDIEHLVGGRVNGEVVPGFLKDEAPIAYHVRVEYQDVDPNTPEALQISAAERINVPTPPLVEANQIKRLLGAGLSFESVARSFGIHPKSVHNKLLILHVIPEVQQAMADGKVSLRALKDTFFIETKQKGIVPKSPEDQLRLLEKIVGASSKHQSAQIRQEIKAFPSDLKCVSCNELLRAENTSKLPDGSFKHIGCSVADSKPTPAPSAAPPAMVPANGTAPHTNGAAPTAPAASGAQPTAPTGAPPMPPPKPVSPKKGAAEAPTILNILPRAAQVMKRAWETTALPDPEHVDAKTYFKAKENLARVETAGAVLDFLGGNVTALADYPEVHRAVTEALGQAKADQDAAEKEAAAKALEAKGMTPKQQLASAIVDLFTDWEDADPDERGEWPSTDAEELAKKVNPQFVDSVRENLGKIQAAYAEKIASGDEAFKRDFAGNHGDFARDWVMSNLLK